VDTCLVAACLVLLCSHDILAVRRWNIVANRARAVNMMTNDTATAAYINNALLPMLAALKEPIRPGGPTYLDAVVSWDVLNEPEGLSQHWRLYKVWYVLVVTCCEGPNVCNPKKLVPRIGNTCCCIDA
jgi:hypothetical protein